MIVWVVLSNNGIEGVYSTKDAAYDLLNLIKLDYYDSYIEEYEVDYRLMRGETP